MILENLRGYNSPRLRFLATMLTMISLIKSFAQSMESLTWGWCLTCIAKKWCFKTHSNITTRRKVSVWLLSLIQTNHLSICSTLTMNHIHKLNILEDSILKHWKLEIAFTYLRSISTSCMLRPRFSRGKGIICQVQWWLASNTRHTRVSLQDFMKL